MGYIILSGPCCKAVTDSSICGSRSSHAPENNQLDLIRRKPSERVHYKAWCKDIIADYGSITSYMCEKRLGWIPLAGSSAETDHLFAAQNPTPFADARDYRILRNDWSYGAFSTDITHPIVWLKPRIVVEPETGLMTKESKALAEDFVDKMFVETLRKDDGPGAKDRVLWFKNWTALQSVRGLEHIHVLVRDVSDEVITKWTGEQATE